MVDMLMPTYGNGELCSRLLFNAINRAYLRRVSDYYSYTATLKKGNVELYRVKDGEYMRSFPPLGDNVRNIYDEASNSNNNPWKISD